MSLTRKADCASAGLGGLAASRTARAAARAWKPILNSMGRRVIAYLRRTLWQHPCRPVVDCSPVDSKWFAQAPNHEVVNPAPQGIHLCPRPAIPDPGRRSLPGRVSGIIRGAMRGSGWLEGLGQDLRHGA